MQTKTKLTLKINLNHKIDLPKLNTVKSTTLKDEVESKKIKSKEIKPNKTSAPQLEKVTLDFQEIYNKLHNKFPNIINMQNPVILAIGIHKELAKEVKISNQSIGKWISWYIRKSKYYINHKEGVARFNLNGEQCGTITEKEANLSTSRKNAVNIRTQEIQQ